LVWNPQNLNITAGREGSSKTTVNRRISPESDKQKILENLGLMMPTFNKRLVGVDPLPRATCGKIALYGICRKRAHAGSVIPGD
jgi:hypothetical protein